MTTALEERRAILPTVAAAIVRVKGGKVGEAANDLDCWITKLWVFATIRRPLEKGS